MKCFELRILYSSYAVRGVSQPQSRTWTILNFSHLTGRIDNLCGEFLILEFDDFAESVLDCRVVTFYKVPINELDSQGRFP